MDILIDEVLHRISMLDARVGLVATMCGRTTPLGERMAEEPVQVLPVCPACLAEEVRRAAKFAREVQE